MRPFVVAVALALALSGCAPNAGQADYHVYVSSEESGVLSVIEPGTWQVTQTIPLGKRPRGMAVDRNGERLLIALTGSPASPPWADESTLPPPDLAADGVAIVSTTTGTVETIDRDIPDPEQLAISPSGEVSSASQREAAVLVGIGNRPFAIPVGGEPEAIAVSPDGKTILVGLQDSGELLLIDRARKAIRKRIAVGKRPRGIAVSPDGKRAYVANENGASLSVVDLAAESVVATGKIAGEGAKPMGVRLSGDARTVYVTTGRGGELVALDAVSGVQRQSVKAGQRPWGLALSPDGKYAFTANGQGNDVAVIELPAMKVVARIKVGGKPWGVAVAR